MDTDLDSLKRIKRDFERKRDEAIRGIQLTEELISRIGGSGNGHGTHKRSSIESVTPHQSRRKPKATLNAILRQAIGKTQRAAFALEDITEIIDKDNPGHEFNRRAILNALSRFKWNGELRGEKKDGRTMYQATDRED